MDVTIREMTSQDIKQVQDVASKTWQVTYAGIIPFDVQKNFLKEAYRDERMKQRLEHSNLYVAESNGNVIGFANFTQVKANGTCELGAIYLYPAYQGRGIGTALLQKGIQELAGLQKLYLHVEKKNKIGLRFYKAKGFKGVQTYEENFGGHWLQTIQMVFDVSSHGK